MINKNFPNRSPFSTFFLSIIPHILRRSVHAFATWHGIIKCLNFIEFSSFLNLFLFYIVSFNLFILYLYCSLLWLSYMKVSTLFNREAWGKFIYIFLKQYCLSFTWLLPWQRKNTCFVNMYNKQKNCRFGTNVIIFIFSMWNRKTNVEITFKWYSLYKIVVFIIRL